MTRPTMKKRSGDPRLWIVAIALVSATLFACVIFLVRHRGYLFDRADPLGYYVYARSLLHDHDLRFDNEFGCFSATSGVDSSWRNPRTRRYDNIYTIGTALVDFPFYVVSVALLHPAYPRTGGVEGFPWLLDQALFSYGGLIAGFLGLWLTFEFVRLFFGPRDSVTAVVLVWCCSPLLFYFIRVPFTSHLPSLFAVSLLLFLWKTPSVPRRLRPLLMGLSAALIGMVRQQDLVIVVLLLGFTVISDRMAGLTWGETVRFLALFAAGFFSLFSLQMITWRVLTGSFLTYSYQGFGFDYWNAPKLVDVLFSSNHGLFSWHPFLLLSLAGLLVAPKRARQVSAFLAASFAATLYVTSSWCCWWMAHSFGHRAFIGMTPVFVFGIAAILTRVGNGGGRRLVDIVAGLLFVWNIVLMLAYLSEMIPYEGEFSWWSLIRRLPGLFDQIGAKVGGL